MSDEAHREYHEVANIFPLMQGAEFDALKADIAEHGLREPIWLHPNGSIIDGRNRHRACVELGIVPDFEMWNGHGSLVAFVVSLNLHRRHLSESQRAMVAAKLANMGRGNPQFSYSANLQNSVSQSEAANLLQVSPRSIANARTVYAGGDPVLVDQVERGEVAVSAAARVAALPSEWQRVIVDHDEVRDAAKDMRLGHVEAVEERIKPHVSHNSGNNEWYTPEEYIESARVTMGVIELDPATSDEANQVVRAQMYYTAEDDGLAQEWHGKVWMNPPYASDLVGRFADKLIGHYEAGQVGEAIVLVNNATETQWFQSLARCASAICFPARRVKFWSPDGGVGQPLQGQAVLYLGHAPQDFEQNFACFGLLVRVA